MKKLNILFVALLSFVSIFATACGGGDTLRISEVAHSVFYAPMYIADNLGYFEEEGLKISIELANGSDLVMASLVSKSADIGLLGPEAVVYTQTQGKKPKIFGQLTACDGSFLVGRNSEEVKNFNWQNLKGKNIIGGRRAGLPAMSLEYAMKQNGLKPGAELGGTVDSILDLTVSFALTVPTFTAPNSKYDYVTVFEPTASQLVANKQGYIVTPVGTASGKIPFTAFAAMDSYMNKHPEKIEKFLRAVRRGYNYLINATDAEIAIALKPSFSTTDDSLLISSVRNYMSINAFASSFVLSEQSWALLHDVIESAGELRGERIPYADAIDNRFALIV